MKWKCHIKSPTRNLFIGFFMVMAKKLPRTIMAFIPMRDSNGFQLMKPQVADPGLHYEPRSFDLWAGKYNSLYNRKVDGGGSIESAVDYGDAYMHFYDSDMVELVKGGSETDAEFQARLDANCHATKVSWNPAYDRKPIGAVIQVLNTPNFDAYLWAYVDMSVIQMGTLPYLEGGWNLRFFLDKHPFRVDSRTTSDEVLPAGIPLCFLVRHGLLTDANRFGLQVMLEHYKA